VLGKVLSWPLMEAMLAVWLASVGSSGSMEAWMSAACVDMGLVPADTAAPSLVTTLPTAGLAASTAALRVA
jgi:hypothetical protein